MQVSWFFVINYFFLLNIYLRSSICKEFATVVFATVVVKCCLLNFLHFLCYTKGGENEKKKKLFLNLHSSKELNKGIRF